MMNIYSVLDSDDEEKPVKQVATKKEKAAPAPAAAPVKNEVKSVPAKGSKTPRPNTAPAKGGEFEAPPEKSDRKPKHHDRHGAKHHHADGSVVEQSNRKRQYDRRSGTGRGKGVSKDGAGGANWGSEKLDALAAEKHIAGETVVNEEPAAPADEVVVENAVEENKDETPERTITLDEYNKRRAEARSNNEAFAEVSIRAVSNEFAGLKAVSASTDDYLKLGASKSSKGKREQKAKTVVDVAFTVAPAEVERPERRERTGRGEGRGQGRGGRGRGGDRERTQSARGGNRNGPKVDFSDAEAFPSLS